MQLEFVEDNYCIFELLGPEALGKIALIFDNINSTAVKCHPIGKYFQNITDVSIYPKNLILYLTEN